MKSYIGKAPRSSASGKDGVTGTGFTLQYGTKKTE